jgi:hypothetical protein
MIGLLSSVLGTLGPKTNAAECPQLARADIMPERVDSGFDPERSLRLRRSTSIPAPLRT